MIPTKKAPEGFGKRVVLCRQILQQVLKLQNQTEVARRMHITQPMLSDYERGKRYSSHAVFVVASAFENEEAVRQWLKTGQSKPDLVPKRIGSKNG